MPAQLEPGQVCASYFAEYDVPSDTSDTSYRVSLHGGEVPPTCTCMAFRFQKVPRDQKFCKHIAYVQRHACMWNCQWNEGNTVSLEPVEITETTIPDSKCPNCGGPTVAMMIAV